MPITLANKHIKTLLALTGTALLGLALFGCTPGVHKSDEFYMKGQLDQAAAAGEEDLARLEKKAGPNETTGEIAARWTRAFQLMNTYTNTGRYHQAKALGIRYLKDYDRDFARLKKSSSGQAAIQTAYLRQAMPGLRATVLYNVLRSFQGIGDATGALPWAEVVLREYKKASDPAILASYGGALAGTFWAFQENQRDEEAAQVVKLVESKYRVRYGKNAQGEVTSVSIGWFPMTQQMIGSAKDKEMMGYMRNVDRMQAYGILGSFYLDQGDYARAEVLERAAEKARVEYDRYLAKQMSGFMGSMTSALMPDQTRMIEVIGVGREHQLTRILVKRGKGAEAVPLAMKMQAGIKKHESRLMWQREYLWEIHKTTGDALMLTGRIDEAITYYMKSAEQVELVRGHLRSARSKILFVTQRNQLYDSLIAALADKGRFTEAFEYSERARARAFLDLMAQKAPIAPDKQAQTMLASRKQLISQVEQEARQVAAVKEEQAKGEVLRGLMVKKKKLKLVEQDLAKQYPELASAVSVKVQSLKQIQAGLEQGDLIVEYHLGPKSTVILAVGRQSLRGHVIPLGRKEIARLVGQARSQIQAREKRPAAAQKLYELLISPVAAEMKAAQRVCIVPHGQLHYLPFQALHDGSRYLVQDAVIYYAPSANVLRFCRAKRRKPDLRLLALGNPALSDPAMALPSAEAEVKALASAFPGSIALVRSQASLSSFNSKAPSYPVIHLAAHGVYDPVNPMLSGLLLAGAQGEKPNLTAEKVQGLKLQACLVTLSGCETALGKTTSGDEVIGLTRAFLYAGAPSVVSSLWKVADRSTQELMQDFYGSIKGSDKASALSAAQRKMLKARPEPFYWAPFVVHGDWM